MRTFTAVLTSALLMSVYHPALAAAHPNPALLRSVKSCEADARGLLPQLVAIDSGTGDAQGLKAMADVIEPQLHALGALVTREAPTPPGVGDNVVATWTGSGRGRVLLIAHMDTVFARGDAARLAPHWDGDRYVGPGAGDDKSGIVIALCALRALGAVHDRDFGRITLILNASEETGSFGSKALITRSAHAADLTINLERGVPSDEALVARKGSGVLTIEATGKAAHSGLEPQNGRNAVLEAARIALALGGLADPARETTVTVDMLHGGERTNVVPDHATLKADVRAFTSEEFDRVERAAADLAAHPQIEGVTLTSSLQRSFPPWPHAASTDRILARANRLYAEIGHRLTPTQVGSSADVSLAAATGTPAIDGMGVEGDHAHTPQDVVDFASFVPRTYLLARLLMDVGHDPGGM